MEKTHDGKDANVPSKTPERIKRNLEDALKGSGEYCPYKYSFICNSKLIADALDLIQQLETDNERLMGIVKDHSKFSKWY